MSRAKIQDAATLIGMVFFVLLILLAVSNTAGCSSGSGVVEKTQSWVQRLFSAESPGDSDGGGSALDQINMKVLIPAAGFWFAAASVGLFLSIVTALGPKIFFGGLAAFGLTLGLIVAVSLIQSLWWVLLIVALVLIVLLGFAARKWLAQNRVVRAFLNPNMLEKDRLDLIVKTEKLLGVPITNGDDAIAFGRKKVKLKRKPK